MSPQPTASSETVSKVAAFVASIPVRPSSEVDYESQVSFLPDRHKPMGVVVTTQAGRTYYRAQVSVRGVWYLGTFSSSKIAAAVVDFAKRKLAPWLKPHARALNFPDFSTLQPDDKLAGRVASVLQSLREQDPDVEYAYNQTLVAASVVSGYDALLRELVAAKAAGIAASRRVAEAAERLEEYVVEAKNEAVRQEEFSKVLSAQNSALRQENANLKAANDILVNQMSKGSSFRPVVRPEVVNCTTAPGQSPNPQIIA